MLQTDLVTPEQFRGIVIRDVSSYPVRIPRIGPVQVARWTSASSRLHGHDRGQHGRHQAGGGQPARALPGGAQEIAEINKRMPDMKI